MGPVVRLPARAAWRYSQQCAGVTPGGGTEIAVKVWPHMMDERSLSYTMSADACEKLASVSTSDVAKATYRDLANLWRELARRVETLNRERPDDDRHELT